MPRPKGKAGGSSVREGGTRLKVSNSGLEVWLYDDANRERIRQRDAADPGFGGMPPKLAERMGDGLVLGYSLYQDDDLDIAVHVGKPLTEKELSVGRWLEPQAAFLRLPSGILCVESNDASRIGPEEATEKGGVSTVPPGDYRVTLYRIDHEALDREGLKWRGPQEVIVLTPGGTPADAADFLLPFEPRRDTSWVGRYKVHGKRAEGLVWFADGWDTFTLNLNSNAVSQLALVPGTYLRTQVPTAGITLISTFAESWDDARRLPPPAGIGLEEYGYAALQPMADWNGAEALFCRRETSKARIEDQHQTRWIPAVIEVLDARPEESQGLGFTATQLGNKDYFDSGFLALVLSDLLPDAADLDELPLQQAVNMLDDKLVTLGLTPHGDVSWQERIRMLTVETTGRLYSGLPDRFAAIMARDGSFEVVFLSELDDETWVVTGLADETDRRIMRKGKDGLPQPHPRIRFATMDESLPAIFAAHDTALRRSNRKSIPAPRSLEECVAAFGRFLTVASG